MPNSQTGCPDNRCSTLSVDCAERYGDYAVCQIGQKTQEAVQWFQNGWDQITGQLAKDAGQASSCWEEQTLTTNGPVQFDYDPQFPFPFQTSGGSSSLSGQISGNATFGLPMDVNFVAQVEMFYIPCLTIDGVPISLRPKSVGAHGTLV